MSRTSSNLLSWVLAVAIIMTSAFALAVVRLTNVGGTPATNQTVTITLPGGEVREAESDDDDGLLYWLNSDGTRGALIDSLPSGTQISGGFGFTNVSGGGLNGLTTGALLVATGGAIALANEGDNNQTAVGGSATSTASSASSTSGDGSSGDGSSGDGGSSTSTSSTSGGTVAEGALDISGGACNLECTEGESVGSSGTCNVDLINSGPSDCGDVDWMVDSHPSGVGVSPASGTLGCGETQMVDISLDSPCSGSAASGDVIFSGSNCSGCSASANVGVTVNPPPMGRGELVIEGSIIIDLGEHDPNSTPCFEPSDKRVFRNDGDQEITVEIEWGEFFIEINGDTQATTITIPPGGTLEVMFNFNCNGFGGQSDNTQYDVDAVVTVRDAEGNLDGPGSLEVRVFVGPF